MEETKAECHPNVIRCTKSAVHDQSTYAAITVQGNFIIEQSDSNQRVIARFCFFQNCNNNVTPVPSKATENKFVSGVEHNYSIRLQESRNEASKSQSMDDETLAVHSKTAEPIIFQQTVHLHNFIHM